MSHICIMGTIDVVLHVCTVCLTSCSPFQLVVEAADGATLAAAMSDQLKQMEPNMIHIGIILCWGNVDMDSLPWYTHGWSRKAVISGLHFSSN